MIQSGQTYRSLDPRGGPRIRIERYMPGDARAHVVDAYDGKRFRQILASTLHATDTTRTGAKRRTGYVLEASADKAPAAPQEPLDGPESAGEAPGGELAGRDGDRGAQAASGGSLRQQIAAALMSCQGGSTWDAMADAVLTVVLPHGKLLGDQLRDAEAVIARVINLADVWQDAPDPLARAMAADLANTIRGPQPPAHNAGPTIRECADADRLWPLQKHGE